MDDQDTLFTSPAKREPWNKGKFTGAKPPRGRNMSGRSGASCKPREERVTDVQSGHRQQAPRLRCRCVKGRGHSLDTWCARANSKGVIQKNRNVRCGSQADMPWSNRDVRFTPESGHPSASSRCQLCAKSRHQRAHSTRSSAMESTLGGIVSPSALAVVRLIVSSNFVGCWTGRSDGLAPLRI
jgi:hypothetical protein